MTSKVLPTYAFTAQLATLEPPPSKMQQLLGAVYGNQAAMDDFVSLTPGHSRSRCSSLPSASAGPSRQLRFRASGWRSGVECGHRHDRAVRMTQAVVADRSDQDASKSNMLTSSDNQQLRVP